MKRRNKKNLREQLQLTKWGIRRCWDGKTIEAVAWSDLAGIWILTTDEGPLREDLFWMFESTNGGGCAVTSTLAERSNLIGFLSKRFGEAVDFAAIIDASCSTDVARFWIYPKGEERMSKDINASANNPKKGRHVA